MKRSTNGTHKLAAMLSPKQRFRLENLGFILLLVAIIGMLGWLSQRHNQWWDWSGNQGNSLATDSIQLVSQLQEPLTFELFASPSGQSRIKNLALLKRYQRQQPERINIEVIDPAQQPEYSRDKNITIDGEVVLHYGIRQINIKQVTESAISDSLFGLLRKQQRNVLFLTGHGERKPQGQANHDYQQFSRQLNAKGIEFQTHSLLEDGPLEKDIQLLVIADPRVPLLANEQQILIDYISAGGNLLWLSNPQNQPSADTLTTTTRRDGLGKLALQFGIDFLPGVIVDATTQHFGIDDPTISLVTQYPQNHPLTQGFEVLSLFPKSAALEFTDTGNNWQTQPILQSPAQSWTEVGPIEGNIGFDGDQGERAGPLNIAFSLTRPPPAAAPTSGPPTAPSETSNSQQRIIIIADSDFISNSYLGNSGNLELGLRIVNWLLEDDTLLEIPPRQAADTQLNLSPNAQILIGSVFLFFLPLGLLISGLLIWRRRQRL